MEFIAQLLHYGGIIFCMAFASGGVAVGQGIAGGGGAEGLSRQQLAEPPVRRAVLVGLAFIETGSVFALVCSLLYLFKMPFTPTLASGLAVCGVSIGMGVSACIVGIASGFVVLNAINAMARQPFKANKIASLMMLTQMLLEAPAVFAFILCFLVRSFLAPDMSVVTGLAFGLAGVILGLASVGPAIGQSLFASSACTAVGTNIDMFPRIFSFAFVVQAIIETPIIFGLLLALSMTLMLKTSDVPVADAVAALLGATCAFGFGSIGAGIGSGFVAARAARSMVEEPEQYTVLLRTTIICQAVIDTALIYSLIIAFFLLRQCM